MMTTAEFRFHTGSIKRAPETPAESEVESFDSILVRLKVEIADGFGKFQENVSIPYWFD